MARYNNNKNEKTAGFHFHLEIYVYMWKETHSSFAIEMKWNETHKSIEYAWKQWNNSDGFIYRIKSFRLWKIGL